MENQHLDKLIEKYILKTASIEEQQELLGWYNEQNNQDISWPSEKSDEEKLVKQRLLLNINARIQSKSKSGSLWPRITGIAAAVIGIAVCVYFFTGDREILKQVQDDVVVNDIAPGGNRATLTSNGNTINLSEAKTGIVIGDNLAYNDNTFVIQSDSEGAKSRSLGTRDDKGNEMTVQTPRGGTYSIVLQDGTKVWLNADSKLEFYSNYRNKLQRIVKLLAGEAYFEVAKNKRQPFIVQCTGQEITVLGTHFNISAYGDDVGIRTTLLEGSVRVASLSSRANAKDLDPRSLGTRDGMTKGRVGMTKPRDGEAVTLRPNQQSLLTNSKIEIKEVDASQAIAWKEGRFSFQNEPLESIMQKVARWYNISVVYENQALRSIPFWGTVSRFSNASNVLKKLEMTGEVHFRIEGRTVYVQK